MKIETTVTDMLAVSLFLAITDCSQNTKDVAIPDQKSAAHTPAPADSKRVLAQEGLGSPRAIELCANGNLPEVYPTFRHCRRWRLVVEELCTTPQPSFGGVDPCRCLCDLCLSDDHCQQRAGGRCVELPSSSTGEFEERTCVYPGDACGGPNPPCPTGMICVTNGGQVSCQVPIQVSEVRQQAETPPPVPVTPRLSAGDSHNCVVNSKGAVYCWGSNDYGQLGDGTKEGRLLPVPVSGLTADVIDIDAGLFGHTCAIKKDGTLWCWGANAAGQLGDGSGTNRSVPVPVTALGGGIVQVTAGGGHTCALKNDGSLWCWGNNEQGQLGDGSRKSRAEPMRVGALKSDTLTVSAGYGHTCAVKKDGTLWCWGWNHYGQLGAGTNEFEPVPRQVSAPLGKVAEVAAGAFHTCARSPDGTVWCWGAFDPTRGEEEGRNTPLRKIIVGKAARYLAAGGNHACALDQEGSIWCWGDNEYGQLGQENKQDRMDPQLISFLGTGNLEVSCGGIHTCAMKKDHTLWCWGANSDGQLGDGTRKTKSIPVKVRLSRVTRQPRP